jgi:predicted nucleic acid-binding protein
MIFGYSEVKGLFKKFDQPIQLLVDTNVLVSASYEADKFNDKTRDLIKNLSEYQAKLFCNVNIRSEFLEIQRRIIFTEALLDFESAKPSHLPIPLKSRLSSIRTNQTKREFDDRDPLRLADAEIKKFKKEMSAINGQGTDLWTEFCLNKVGDKIGASWHSIVENLGLNFLSTTDNAISGRFIAHPKWTGMVKLMEIYGLASADAMVINMFNCTDIPILLSSDFDVGLAVSKIKGNNKYVLVPDSIKKELIGLN